MDLRREELSFARGLVSALREAGVEKIDILSDEFREKSKEVGEKLKEEFSGEYEPISTLFIRRPIMGTPERLIASMKETLLNQTYARSDSRELYINHEAVRAPHLEPNDVHRAAANIYTESYCTRSL